MTWRVLELFSGLGGWRHALAGRGEVVAAYDISPHANAAYALNHGHRPHPKELASLSAVTLLGHGADTWVLSPPCQPFCRMGNRQGLEDRRSRAFLRLLEILEDQAPERLVLENVLGFQGSEAHDRLRGSLERQGLHVAHTIFCPTALGIPNQRPRFYLVASRRPLKPLEAPHHPPGPLAPYLDAVEDPDLYLSEAMRVKHGPGLDLVTPEDRRSTCFIGGYGQRFVGSGSFLVTPRGVRRFSPSEVARLLGYPDTFRFPEGMPLEVRYKLLGNGLSLPAARWVLGHLGG